MKDCKWNWIRKKCLLVSNAKGLFNTHQEIKNVSANKLDKENAMKSALNKKKQLMLSYLEYENQVIKSTLETQAWKLLISTIINIIL